MIDAVHVHLLYISLGRDQLRQRNTAENRMTITLICTVTFYIVLNLPGVSLYAF